MSDSSIISNLKRIAWTSFLFQCGACVFHMFMSLFWADSNDSVIVCGLIAISGALIPLYYALLNRNFLLVLNCVSAFNITPIWFLYLEGILPGYDAYEYISPELRIQAFFWVSIFQLSFNFFYILFGPRLTRSSINLFSFLNRIKLGSEFYAKISLYSFFVPLVCFYFFYGSFDILWTALTAGRAEGGGAGLLMQKESLGGASVFMLPFNWIWQLTPLFSSIAFVSSGSKAKGLRIFSLVLGLLVIFVFFLGGSRGTMLLVAAPAVFFFFYFNWDRGIKFWLIAGCFIVVVVGIMELQVRFRGNLLEVITDPDAAAKAQGFQSATSFDVTETHRDNNLYLFCLMIKGYPDKYAYAGFNDFFATLANPIPRAIWPGKPILGGAKDISTQSAYILDGPITMGTTSLSTSIVGNAYYANGLWGIIVFSMVYSIILLYFDGVVAYTQAKEPLAIGILGITVFLSFWGYRGFFAFISFLYPITLLILILRTVKIKKR